MRIRLLAASLTVVAALGAAACDQPTSDPDTAANRAASTAAGDRREAVAERSVLARARGGLDVFAEPADATPSTVLPASTGFGSPTTLLVDGRDGDWLHVLLPTRPNGSSGWVRSDDVSLHETAMAVDVDLDARRLAVWDDGDLVVDTAIAVGAPDVPTPRGSFFVTDVLDTPDGGAYGPFALGLSAHSEVLTEFAGGDGQVGIHGTNDPSSIGRAVSHGCVRVPDDVIASLAGMLPLGTPVTVH